MYLSGCFSLINKPTRIISTSATILDRPYLDSNSLQKIFVSRILISDVSDHLPTLCNMKSNVHRSFTPGIMVRDLKKFNIEAFSEDVNNRLEYLSSSLNDDPNTKNYDILSSTAEATNLHAPLKKFYRKKMKMKAKPWFTKDLLESISRKNKLFEKCYKQ